MPLINSSSKEAVSENIRRERDAGKPQRQAVAIALDVARRAKKAAGGGASTPWYVRNEARGMTHTGPLRSTVPGRTDNLPLNVPAGAYVLPSSHVSYLGQDNTQAGMAVLDHMFKSGPYNTSLPRLGRGRGPKMRADGGDVGEESETVPIMAAGGEYVLTPEQVMEIGNGDLDDGHKILDHWVVETRKKHVKELKRLPGPSK